MREIITEKTLAYSRAFVFVLENFVEMVKSGHSDLSLCINNSMPVTYAVENGQIIGSCVYEMDPLKRQAWIYAAAVDKNHRGTGVYDEIYLEVEKICRDNGMVVLNSNIHIDNAPMIANAQKHGRDLLWYRSRKFL